MGTIEAMRQVLAWQGGVATRGELVTVGSPALLTRAVREGQIDRVGQGRYVLPDIADARRAAAAAHGAVSHLSAAIAHGWEVLREPDRCHVTLPRGKSLPVTNLPRRRKNVSYHYATLSATERERHVTDPVRTVLDCARFLPFGEALAVADSALRHCSFDHDELLTAAAHIRGPGARRVRRVAQHATAAAANPFESLVRAISLDVPGLTVKPQAEIDLPMGLIFVDLADTRLRIVIEADSFAFHGTRSALIADAARYNWLTISGWRVLRITWEAALDDPALVAHWLGALVNLQRLESAG
ncbi:MAG: DUF559 domain-containing protein [Actinobacteria bacterium]|nr:DUF559 domain-containing protein [Actinomycetota bacterium]